MQPFLADISTTEAGDFYYGHVLRSPVTRGRIRALRLQSLPEGYYLIRGRDIPGKRTLACAGFSHPVLGDPRVQYRGQPFALLGGPDREVLAELAESVRVDWDEQPAQEAAHPDSSVTMPSVAYRRGDPDKAFRGAVQIVEAEYTTERRRIHDPDLPGAFVQPADKGLIVYASTQDPFGLREALAAVLRLPSRRVRVVATRLANPMEGKFILSALVAAHAAVLAAISKKPVWLSTAASDNYRYGFPGPGFRIRQQTALDREGNLLGARLEIELQAGAYAPAVESILLPAARCCWGGYRIPNLEIKATTVCSSQVPTGPCRAAGRAQAFFAAELNSSRLEEISELDPYMWKSHNLLRGDRSAGQALGAQYAAGQQPGGGRADGGGEGQDAAAGASATAQPGVFAVAQPGVFAVAQPGVFATGPRAVLDAVVEMANFRRKHASFAALKKRRQRALDPPYPLRGVGLAVGYQERQDAGVFITRPHTCAVRAVLDIDKRLHLYTSLVDHGPGIHAMFAERAAKLLELDPGKVIVEGVDTQVVPDTGASTLSRALSVGLPLIEQCCQAIKLKRMRGLLPIEVRRSCRQPQLEGTGQSLASSPGRRLASSPGRSLASSPAPESLKTPALAEAAWGATVVEVEVDPASLQITMRGIWTAMLCGSLGGLPGVEPYAVGEVIRAAGWASLAESVSGAEGLAAGMEPPAWAAGSLPRLAQIPPIVVRFVEDPNPAPRGFEQLAHLTVPPAYAAAISQATGLYVDRIPITPEVLQECLET